MKTPHLKGRSAILYLDMSFTLKMFRERQLNQALESRKLSGYFNSVISVHPLAGLFESGSDRFGDPVVTRLDDGHVFVEGKIGVSKGLSFLPPLNLLLAQSKLLFLLLRMARRERVGVVRIGDPYFLGIMGWALSRLLRVPLVIRTCFDYDLLFATTKKAVFPRLFRYRSVEKRVERFVFPRCAMVAGANQNNLDYAIANGADPEDGVVFRYGNLIHPAHFEEPSTRNDGKRLLAEVGLRGDFLTTVSRLEPMKQPEQNLLAFERVRNHGYDVKFLFIGDGSMRQQLETMAAERGLAGNIFFAGNRSQEWIAQVLPQARIVLSPHMGRALTEACLAAAPIVAYDYDWQGEIIRSGETGELIDNGDWNEMANRAIQLLNDPVRACRLGRKARRIALRMMDPKDLEAIEIRAYESILGNTA